MLVHLVEHRHFVHDRDGAIVQRRLLGQRFQQLERLRDAQLDARLGVRQRYVGLIAHIPHGQNRAHHGGCDKQRQRERDSVQGHAPEREPRCSQVFACCFRHYVVFLMRADGGIITYAFFFEA